MVKSDSFTIPKVVKLVCEDEDDEVELCLLIGWFLRLNRIDMDRLAVGKVKFYIFMKY